ncbi:GNAT family N-acetyltransferase [Deinococcus sp. HMF7604]|uniref:GNAT family N-acetyltransferase n=1 Tax=Deinococcus betulae TaxID=2873312 RepID=UPI001CCF2CCB|nr:GNAT family N-acetyltransferase [Deinococcus betulae]MBZ9752383.1 GNAT family N-acetyltransferase [Deinococcus betulae]
MTDWTIEPARPEALHEVVALLPDPAEAERRLSLLRENVAAGRTHPEQFQLLRSARGLEGVCLLPTPAHIPLLPRLQAGVPRAAAQAFLAHLRRQATPGRQLILDDTLAPLGREAAQAAGWQFQEEAVFYTTDLRARTWPADPQAQRLGPEALTRPDVQRLLAALDRADLSLKEGWVLVALSDAAGHLTALGATGSGGRPSTASIDLIGVHPAARGQGLGRRLHAHLLALASHTFTGHMGATWADNHAMIRIFEGHGAVLSQRHLVFVQP